SDAALWCRAARGRSAGGRDVDAAGRGARVRAGGRASHSPRRSNRRPQDGVGMATFSLTSTRASLLQAPRIVAGLIASAPREALTWREADGAWNGIDVLCHLADGEINNWIPRVQRILGGGGRFTPFDREAGFARYAGWTADQLVGEFGQ